MKDVASLIINDHSYSLPIVINTEQETAIDIGFITLDNGYGNTGSSKSAIIYIDGENGTL